MVDTRDLKSLGGNPVLVRVQFRAYFINSTTKSKKNFKGLLVKQSNQQELMGLMKNLFFLKFSMSKFVGAIVVQLFWEQLHIKYLFVEESFRGQEIAHHLMNYALDFGKKRGYHFALRRMVFFNNRRYRSAYR